MNTTSFLCIGDPHFKISNILETDEMTSKLYEYITSNKPDVIVVMGDVLDRHEIIHVSPLTRATNFILKLKDMAPTYVLIGNHDLKNNKQYLSDEHPFVGLKHYENLTIVDTTIRHMINNLPYVFVPYVPPGRFNEALDNVEWSDATAIFAHQEMKGAKMGAIISENGDDWFDENPYLISGHIHDYQEVKQNILYVGTPFQHAFGDKHDKTISLFEFISKDKRVHTRIDLELRKKDIVRMECAHVDSYIPKENVDLKIIISGVSGEIKAIMKHPNIELWKQKGIKIVYRDRPIKQTNAVTNPTLKYFDILKNMVQHDDQLTNILIELFQ